MPTHYSEKLKATIIDFGANHEATREDIAEEEASRDLQKPLEQLLWDIHCEAHDPDRTAEENIIGTNKRFASLMVRVAKSNDRVSFWMIIFTIGITAMTAALLYFTYLLWQQTKGTQPATEKTTSTTISTPMPISSPSKP